MSVNGTAITYSDGTITEKYNLFKNLQGDVVEVRSKYNALLASYSYDPWGNVVSITDSSGTEIAHYHVYPNGEKAFYGHKHFHIWYGGYTMKTIDVYTAYDNDDNYSDGKIWGKEIDIEGIEYQMLIQKCFEYSSCFSLVFRPCDNKIPYLLKHLHYEKQIEYPEYDGYIINSEVSNKWPGTLMTELIGEVRYYKCCKETLEMLNRFSSSIFSFNFDKLFNPEDLCFYRSDGTVLFASQIEDGECYLFPREDEDFDDVLKTIPWFKSEYPIEKYNKCFNDLVVGMTKEDFLK